MSRLPGWMKCQGHHLMRQRHFSLQGMGDPSPAIRRQFDGFLEQRLGVLPAPGDFFPACHCRTVLLFEQGAAPWGLPVARAPSPAAGALV